MDPTVADPIDLPAEDAFAFQILPLNGFLYRFNKRTGECWRLVPHGTDNKAQMWKPVKEADGHA